MVATWPEAVRKTVGTQTEAPHKHVGIQAAGCRECWSLALAAEGVEKIPVSDVNR